MNKLLFAALLLGSSLLVEAAQQHLLPRPQVVELTTDGAFSINRSIVLDLPAIADTDPAVDEQLTKLIEEYGGRVVDHGDGIISVRLKAVDGAEFQDEAYRIDINSDEVVITAATLRGAYWAVQTLWQLAEQSNSRLDSGSIVDWAAFKLRGYTHDVGRGYLEFETLLDHIEKLSRYKINTFHWHLTENQGWRLESKVYPQLNQDAAYSRLTGKYYTIEQAKELVRFANRHGVTVIPEIDMPGHSQAFRQAMGHSMLTPQGLTEMKAIMTEACETFAETPWMHIGTDELRSEDQGSMDWTNFVPQMVSHIRGQGKKVVSWNPGYSYASDGIDMVHMWSSAGRPITGVPTIDSRYHYANHFDNFADIVSLYKSNIADRQKGSDQYAGVIVAFWNDRYLPSDQAIVEQNSVFASMLAIAERSWLGGGDGYFPTVGTLLRKTDTDFLDWEKRFLYHKDHYLKDEPIPYVKQTNLRWRITDAFPNNGTLTATFPPETEGPADSYTYNGQTYNSADALGAGVYLRHVWGTTVPGFYSNPQTNHTAYAYTYVYSPTEQQVGLRVEFQNYSRSESDLAPAQGKWDYKESRIWINDQEIAPPTWENTHTTKTTEITLKNENMAARAPIPVTLHEGWNKVMMKLPVGAFTINQVRLVKWMFNCVFTTLDGSDAVDGLIYSPDKSTNPVIDDLMDAISRANSALNGISVGANPGQYPQSAVDALTAVVDEALRLREEINATEEQVAVMVERLDAQVKVFQQSFNMPKASTSTAKYWYKIVAVDRENRVVAYRGNDSALYGEVSGTSQAQQWKLVKLTDGTYSIVNRSAESYISPASTYNTALKAQSGSLTSGGWTVSYTGNGARFIVTSGEVQLNQTTSTYNYQIFNWGSGTNTTDGGCLFQFELVDTESTNPLTAAISAANAAISGAAQGDDPGQYSREAIDALNQAIAEAEADLDADLSDAENELSAERLNQAVELFSESYNVPEISNPTYTYWYSLISDRDGEKAITLASGYTFGSAYNGATNQQWKFVECADGTLALVNRASAEFIDMEATAASGGNSPVMVFVPRSGMPASVAWRYQYLHDGANFILFSDLPSQMHMLNSGSAYKIGDYGISATTGQPNTSDPGCKFKINLRATEYDASAIDNVDAGATDGYTLEINGLNATITATEGDAKVRLLDLAGRELMARQGSHVVVEVPSRGIYMLEVNSKIHKVVF